MVRKCVKKVSVYNLWGSQKTFTLSFTEKMNIITGFNGSGKSTVLEILFGSINDRAAPLVSSEDWAAKVELAGKVSVYAIDMAFGNEINNDQLERNTKKIQQSNFENLTIKKFHDDIKFNAIKNTTKKVGNSTLTISNEQEVKKIRKLFKMIRAPKGSPYEGRMLDSIINPIFYREEIFIIPDRPYANIQKGEKSLFNKNVALDITLKELLIDFLSFEKDYNEKKQKQREDVAANDFIKNIDGYFKSLPEGEALKIKKEIMSDWESKLSKIKSSNDRVSNFENEINSFFECTKKRVSRDSRNLICFYDKQGFLIEWNQLSRGEKNLLVLLLLAFLANEDERVFILDEPDLALHIEWQKKILTSMSNLAPNSQFIIATHSPAMLMNNTEFNMINMMDELENEH